MKNYDISLLVYNQAETTVSTVQDTFTVGHKGGEKNNSNLWNDFDNDLFLIDLDNSIHSQIVLNNNWRVFVLSDR